MFSGRYSYCLGVALKRRRMSIERGIDRFNLLGKKFKDFLFYLRVGGNGTRSITPPLLPNTLSLEADRETVPGQPYRFTIKRFRSVHRADRAGSGPHRREPASLSSLVIPTLPERVHQSFDTAAYHRVS